MPSFSLAENLADLWQALLIRKEQGKERVELAFYGGTFTALREEEFSLALVCAQTLIQKRLIVSFRCSTRPDAISYDRLQRLCDSGCTTVELGVQSFSDTVLQKSMRGYSGLCAKKACEKVRDMGLHLGVQLLPGLPAMDPATFLNDVTQALESKADLLRFYPCLVLAKTQLEQMFLAGQYTPWTFAQTREALSEGYLLAQKARVPVIRMGLAPQKELDAAIVAGPKHPALGSIVCAHALITLISQSLCAKTYDRESVRLHLPKQVQGFFWGNKGDLREKWHALGFTKQRVFFEEREDILLIFQKE